MNIKNLLVRMRVPAGGSEERLWNYYSDNGRIFEIRQFGKTKFLLGEFIPNGRSVLTGKSGDVYQDCPVIQLALQSATPNDLCSHLKAQGVDLDSVIRLGTGISLTSYYHDSIDSACNAIGAAIAENAWYSKQVELTEEERQAQENANAFDSVAFWTSCKNRLDGAQGQPGIFKGCHTAIQPVLAEETKQAVLGYLNAPSQAKWLAIRNTLISVSQTLWSAWVAYSGNAPRSGKSGFPSADVLRKSIRASMSAWEKEVNLRISESVERSSGAGLSSPRQLEVINGMR